MSKEANDTKIEDPEIVPEADAEGQEPEVAELTAGQKLKSLRDKLKNCEAEKRQHLEDLQRAKADFLNHRKRLEEDKERDRQRITEGHLRDLLPLCDSFQMAMKDTEAWNAVPDSWRLGVEAIYGQLKSLLKANQVELIDPLGQPFDPEKHEAVSSRPPGPEEEAEPDTVLEVVQPGYLARGEVIRPAKVIISG